MELSLHAGYFVSFTGEQTFKVNDKYSKVLPLRNCIIKSSGMIWLYKVQWRRQDLILEGRNRMGSGAEPQKIFSQTTPSTLAVNATNPTFMD